MPTLIFVVIIFIFIWLFLVLPSRRRQKSHQAMQDSVAIGNEVITAGGIHGIVREAGDADIKLEIAPDVVVTLDRRAIAAVADDVDEDEDEAAEEGEDELVEDEELDDVEEEDQAEESLKG